MIFMKAIEIVDLPSYKMGIFHSFLLVYQRVTCLPGLSWLVVSNMTFMTSISDMGRYPNPIDELHDFSRWWLHHQPDDVCPLSMRREAIDKKQLWRVMNDWWDVTLTLIRRIGRWFVQFMVFSQEIPSFFEWIIRVTPQMVLWDIMGCETP